MMRLSDSLKLVRQTVPDQVSVITTDDYGGTVEHPPRLRGLETGLR